MSTPPGPSPYGPPPTQGGWGTAPGPTSSPANPQQQATPPFQAPGQVPSQPTQPVYGSPPAVGYGAPTPAPAPAPASYRPPTSDYGPPPSPTPQQTSNPGAVLGWVGVAVGLLVGFIGIVLGAISIARSRQARASIAPGVTAVVIGAVQVLAIVAFVVIQVINPSSGTSTGPNPGDVDAPREVDPYNLAAGNCVDVMTWTGEPVTQVPCADPHTIEVISLLPQPGDAYPGEAALDEIADETCYAQVGAAIPAGVDTTDLYQDAILPTLEAWDSGERSITCLLYSEGAQMTGSATAGDLAVQ